MVSTDAIQKADRSPVTVADFGSQALICQAIGTAFPDATIVAEENAQALKENASLLERVTDYVNRFCKDTSPAAETVCEWINRGSGEVGPSFWTLDPIDGTKGFLRHDQYAIALAHIVEGVVQRRPSGCHSVPSPCQAVPSPCQVLGCQYSPSVARKCGILSPAIASTDHGGP